MRALIRVTLLGAALASIGCGPIYSPSGCAKPCPSACSASCLPSGYCEKESWSPLASPPLVRYGGGDSVDVPLGNFPPGAKIDLDIHSVVDLSARDGTVPWDYDVELSLYEPSGDVDLLNQAAFNAVNFPLVSDWSGQLATDATGLLDLQLLVTVCTQRGGRVATGCLDFLPAFQIVAKLSDPTPWEAAPACN